MNMPEKSKSYDLKFKESVVKYAEEDSNRKAGRKFSIYESMFVDGERNRLKSAINLPLKAKREDCLVEGGNHFLETSKKNWWRKLLMTVRNITMFHVN